MLKLKCYILLSTSAFKFSLRRYIPATQLLVVYDDLDTVVAALRLKGAGGGLHSSTFQLNMSRV